MKVQFKGYAVYLEDSHGNEWSALVTDMSDTVCVYGLRETKDKSAYLSFESEAYHLSSFAKDEGLKYVSQEVTIEV